MTDEEHLREVIHEREHTIKVLHGNADAMEKRIWALEARAEAAEKRVTELAWQVNNMRNRTEAAEKRVKELESEFHAMTVEMRAANIARVVEATGTDFVGLANRCEAAEDKLLTIRQWCEAYPLDIFPEPDHRKARALLEAGGMTLDAVSASAMRHVVTRLKETVDLKI